MLYFAIFCVDNNNNRPDTANNETDYTRSYYFCSMTVFIQYAIPYCQFQCRIYDSIFLVVISKFDF